MHRGHFKHNCPEAQDTLFLETDTVTPVATPTAPPQATSPFMLTLRKRDQSLRISIPSALPGAPDFQVGRGEGCSLDDKDRWASQEDEKECRQTPRTDRSAGCSHQSSLSELFVCAWRHKMGLTASREATGGNERAGLPDGSSLLPRNSQGEGRGQASIYPGVELPAWKWVSSRLPLCPGQA